MARNLQPSDCCCALGKWLRSITRLQATGTIRVSDSNLTNTWTGDVASGTYLYLYPSSGNKLQLDGNISSGNNHLYVYNGGTVAFNGTSSNVYSLRLQSGHAEVNRTLSTTVGPYVGNGLTLGGTGSVQWTGTSNLADVRGTINPGTNATTGILTLDDVAFQTSGSLSVQLDGTTPEQIRSTRNQRNCCTGARRSRLVVLGAYSSRSSLSGS